MTLPVPDRHDLPLEATIAVPVPPDGLTVYRLLAGARTATGGLRAGLHAAAGAASRDPGALARERRPLARAWAGPHHEHRAADQFISFVEDEAAPLERALERER
jgi:hypothetical protein